MRSYQDYICKIANIFFLFCHKCRKHESAKDWIRVNYNPREGINIIDIMYKAMGSDHVQVNSIKIKPSVHPQQRYGIAEVEELSQTEEEEEFPARESFGEVNVNPITVNRVPIG